MLMKPTETTIAQVHTEQRFIAKYAGMLFARLLLMVCLFGLFFFMQQIPVYLFAFSILFPWIWSNILAERKKEKPLILFSTAQKYHYSDSRYHAEKITYHGLFFFLIVWQISLWKYNPYDSILLPIPAILLFLFVLARILCTGIIKHQIHKSYTSFDLLS